MTCDQLCVQAVPSTDRPGRARPNLTPMRILVTGAGRAIGAATCNELTAAGHEVVATARDISLLEPLDVALRLPLDVTSDESVAAAVEAAGELDGIINNAALGGTAPLESFPIDRFRAMHETNVVGTLRLVQAVVPAWRVRGSGVIVIIGSVQGRVSAPLGGAYGASKFALEAMAESLHYELRHFGIRTHIVEPGYIAPGMKESGELPRPAAYQELYDQWEGADDTLNAQGRPGPEVVGRAIVDLFAEPSSPLRIPVGADAELILGTRAQLGDAEFEAVMRATMGLTF